MKRIMKNNLFRQKRNPLGNQRGVALILVFWIIALASVFATSLASIAMTEKFNVENFMNAEKAVKLLPIGANKVFYAVNADTTLPELNVPEYVGDGSVEIKDIQLNYFGALVTAKAYVNNIIRTATFRGNYNYSNHPIFGRKVYLNTNDGYNVLNVENGIKTAELIKDPQVIYGGVQVPATEIEYSSASGFNSLTKYETYWETLIPKVNNAGPSYYAEQIIVPPGETYTFNLDTYSSIAANKNAFFVLEYSGAGPAPTIIVTGTQQMTFDTLVLATVGGSPLVCQTVPAKGTKPSLTVFVSDNDITIPRDANYYHPFNSGLDVFSMGNIFINTKDKNNIAEQGNFLANGDIYLNLNPSDGFSDEFGYFLLPGNNSFNSALNVSNGATQGDIGGSNPNNNNWNWKSNAYEDDV